MRVWRKGRRGRLKISGGKTHVGSIPTARTMKDVISEKAHQKLDAAEQANYEAVVRLDPFKISYVTKTKHYGDPNDIIKDKTCDLDFLNGATIQKVGFHKNADEGGLAIEYTKNGESKVVVLGFTELGMWVYANVPVTN
jgi:hypothetical protein